jgi:HEAT repeat protein
MTALYRFVLLGLIATAAPGCFAYCPLYATAGCLELNELDAMGRQGQHPELISHVKDERSWVREAAVQAVGRHKVKAGAQAVAERLTDPTEKRYVRAAAASALADLGNTNVLGDLARVVSAPNSAPELEIAGLSALCRLAPKSPETISAIHSLLDDEDLLVVSAARHRRATGCGQ